MNTNHKTLTLEIPATQYEQLAGIAYLLESLSGVTADVNTVAQKLLLRALNVWAYSGAPVQPVKAQDMEPQPLAEEHEAPEAMTDEPQQETPLVAASVAGTVELDELPEIEVPKLIDGLSEFWQPHLQEVKQGARIAIVSSEGRVATELALSLAQQLNQSGAILYVAPNLIGQFSEILEQFGIEKKECPYRAKAVHYLPDTRTEWKRLLLDSNNAMRYGAVFFDKADEMQLSETFPQWFDNLNPSGDTPMLTQVYVFAIERKKFDDEDFSAWMEQIDVVLYAGQTNEIETIKNIFRDTE